MILQHTFNATRKHLEASDGFTFNAVPTRLKVCTVANGVAALSFNAEQVPGVMDWPWTYVDGRFCANWYSKSGLFIASWTMQNCVTKVGVDENVADLTGGVNTVLLKMNRRDTGEVESRVLFGASDDTCFKPARLSGDDAFLESGPHDLGVHLNAITHRKLTSLGM